jgi:acyl carrier protein
MSNVLDLIEALDEMYFNETSSIKRYDILHKLELAIEQMRTITANEIRNGELAENSPQIEENITDVTKTDDFLFLRIMVLVGECTPDTVNLTMQSKVLDIEKYKDVDSLTMMEILVGIEEILDIDLLNHNLSDETTIQDLFNLRTK